MHPIWHLPRLLLLTLVFTIQLMAADLRAAADLAERGEAALLAANADRDHCVDAALLFGQARALYEEAEQWDKVRELNAYIYWCKKRMNVNDLDRYLAGAGRGRVSASEARTLLAAADAIVDQAVTQGDGAEFLRYAERFAEANRDKPFLVHIRYLEVAERFESLDTPTAIKAMRASSEALDRFASSLEPAKPRAIPPDVFQTAQRPKPGALPMPQGLELTKAIGDIRERYRDRFRAERVAEKKTFMHFLLEQARQSTDQAAACYALVDQAAEIAVDREVRDLLFVIRCADFIDATFAAVDPIALKQVWLGRARGHAAAEAISTLLVEADNAQALAVAGKFLCLESNDWTNGLPLLAETDDADLRRAADMERSKPTDAVQQKELGGVWKDLAKRDRNHREAMQRRALHWYRTAAPRLSGLSKEEAAAAIKELYDALPLLWSEIDWDKLDDETWAKLEGDVVVCRAKHKVTNTGYRIAAGRQVRVVPHPSDRWSFDVGGEKIGSTGYGVEGKGSGTGSIRASFEIKNGSRSFGLNKVTGPGQLYLRPVFPGEVRAGYGEVRCKIVDYPPPD